MRALYLLPLIGVACDLEETVPSGTPLTTPGTPTVVVETVEQTTEEAADVLIVADPALLEDTLQQLPILLDVGIGSGSDWHVGVTSTSLGGGPTEVGRIGWTSLDEPNPSAQLADVPTNPAGPLGAIGAIEAAVGTLAGTVNDGFLRPGTPLHVVVIAQADDATPYADPIGFVDWLGTFGGTLSAEAPATATTYLDLATSLGGIRAEESAAPTGGFIEDAGLLALGATRTFALSAEPVAGTLEVRVLDSGNTLVFEEGTDWTYDSPSNSITFLEYVPSPGAMVELTYEPT